MTNRMDCIPRYVAVHEAGHAVASWAAQKAFGWNWCHFERITIRTPAEMLAGPIVDWKGREIHGAIGLVEGPARYNPLGLYVPEMPIHIEPGASVTVGQHRARQRQLMEADVIDVFGGMVAEAKYRHMSGLAVILTGAKHDWDMARARAQDFTRTKEERGALLDALEKRTARIIQEHWPRVLCLADALLERRVIEGSEATQIIETAG